MSDNNSMSNRSNALLCTVKTEVVQSKGGLSGKGLDLDPLDLLNGLSLACYQPSPEVFNSSIKVVGFPSSSSKHTRVSNQ